jgi:hypothetical protein
MTILASDIKLLQSDNMSDVADGGGAMTANVILDGVSNNIFDDISTLDRVYGAVHMRKLFAAIQTITTDKFFGSMVMLSKLPKDKKIGVNLFSTGDWFDRRDAAKGRVEAYRVQASIYQGFVWSTQYAGSRQLTLFQNTSSNIVPAIGDVFMISNTLNVGQSQYVRVVKLGSNIVQTFQAGDTSYQKRIITVELATPLLFDYVGAEISKSDNLTPNARLFTTVVANAAKYYSARPLNSAAALGDVMVKVDSVYSQVIPSSQAEVALLDLNAGGYTTPIVESGAPLSFITSTEISANKSLHLGNPCKPGSLTITAGSSAITDEAGQIKSGTTVIGTIDYIAGVVNFAVTSPTYTGAKTVAYTPAAAPVRIADTASLAVNAANRGYIWSVNISPPPTPGSLTVSYRALGKWYSLRDNSAGGIVGLEAGIGSGTVNYESGTASITAAVLPDVDSEIIFSWGQKSNTFNRQNTIVANPKITQQLANNGITPTTLIITWTDGTTAKTAVSALNGDISGHATGKVKHSTGLVEFYPTVLPSNGTIFTFNYSFGLPITKEFTHPARNTAGLLFLTLPDQNILPGTLQVEWNTVQDISLLDTFQETVVTKQTWRDPIISATESGGHIKTDVIDTASVISLANGTLLFNPDRTTKLPIPRLSKTLLGQTRSSEFTPGSGVGGVSTNVTTTVSTYRNIFTGFQYLDIPQIYPNDDSGWVKVSYRVADAPNTATETQVMSSVKIDLTPSFAETIVYGSVRFDLGGKTYVDRNGQLFSDIDVATGAGTFAGTLDYSTGTATLSFWAQGQSPTVALKSLLTDISIQPVDMVTFRLPTSPIRQGSFQIRATAFEGGAHLTATANNDGIINTASMFGYINYETGVAQIRFGAWIIPTGHEAESWYDPIAIVGTGADARIFKPAHVMAETIVYNAVSYVYIPLSSAILGLDPVRLPPDGRVPIFSTGDVAVILNDQTTVGTFSNGTTTNLSRVRLAKVVIKDAAGNMIAANKYSVNLDAGTVTWINLSGVSQPITVIDRIEDMGVVTDVQITGQLTLSQPLTHAFPIQNTLVSNAVINGTLYARVSVPFDQQTWTNVWSDSVIGSTVAAQYNSTQYPIVVDNNSAIQERWVLIFTTTSLFNVIGEHVGQIVTGASTNTNTAPINPNTAQPYFTIPAGGWGGGWSAGNVVRFNTYAANAPVWLIQSIGQGAATDPDFTFCIEARGDIDNVA